jgi:transcriptional regulator GlxA family with amidase domain
MKRLEQYISLNIDRRISLDDMAAAVGLSKMHFAAQFRAMTGFRPREYLLFKRIERAKAVMTTTGMPLVEVAFAAGAMEAGVSPRNLEEAFGLTARFDAQAPCERVTSTALLNDRSTFSREQSNR